MRNKLLVLLLCVSFSAHAQNVDEKAILSVLQNQTVAWNKGDIDAFMKGYWNHDSLMFIGKSGVTYGYQNTMNNYKRNYSDTVKMGKLFFDILHVKKLSAEYYFVVGRFFLKRSIGDLGGHYTLLFRKINNKWVIISDHTS